MREIKFRAWDLATQKMYQVEQMNFGLVFAGLEPIYMQYTGIQIDGVDLYEGDIVEYIKEKTDPEDIERRKSMGLPYKQVNSEVFFRDGSFMIYIDHHGSYIELSQTGSDYPILGNKYQNPELLK